MRKGSRLIRTSTNPVVNEGEQKGTIVSVEEKEFESQYHDSGIRDAINFKVELLDANGEVVHLYYAPTITWAPKGKLMRTLQDLQAVPEVGEELDLEQFIGMDVTVTIENTERNQTVYSNIVKVKKGVSSIKSIAKRRSRSKAENVGAIFEEDDLDVINIDEDF
ncbi:hypothetical protein [Lederbergia citrea]|uniref:Uncharacterized protein n=1 Tax=Lederbergia citrea TaxID=2833581 RepID=A0A942Z5Z9_9BACI|nr:hypothetical protein [Lederbergia citrea]MBS4223842.1 hypothetical protein [Lederbergia citrea]